MGYVLYSEVAEQDGNHSAQVLMQGGGAGEPGEVHFPYGLFARAPDPKRSASGEVEATGAATALYWVDSYDLHVMPLEDPRAVDRLPTLKHGETCLYAQAGQFIRLHEDGSISLATTDKGGKLEGRPVTLQIGPTGLFFAADWGRLIFDKTGFHAVTTSGARIDLGPISGLPPPLDSLSTMAVVKAGTITLDAASVAMGGIPNPTAIPGTVPKYEPLAAFLTTIVAQLTTLTAGLQSLAAQGNVLGGEALRMTDVQTALAAATTQIASVTTAASAFSSFGKSAQVVT